jgi:hypothetical protein
MGQNLFVRKAESIILSFCLASFRKDMTSISINKPAISELGVKNI